MLNFPGPLPTNRRKQTNLQMKARLASLAARAVDTARNQMPALNFRRLALALAVPLLALALPQGGAAEPAPATMVVSLVVQQSCSVSSAGGSATPVVSCEHGEPWLLSQTDMLAASTPSRLRAARDSVWTVVF